MEDAKEDLGHRVWIQAEQRAAQGGVLFVRELGVKLAARHAEAADRVREYERQLAHVVRVLALTPGRDSLVQLLQLLEESQSAGGPGLLPPFVASLLAEHQQVDDLASIDFDRRGWNRLTELRACLFHELVVRGVEVEKSSPLHSWSLRRPAWHALSWLPGRRSEFEVGLNVAVDFPSRSISGSARGASTGLPDTGRMDPPTPRRSERLSLRDTATVDVHETIVAAVQAGGWGDCAAWVFMLDEPIAPDRVPALLPTLPMRCVDGLGPMDRFEVALRPAAEIWRLLFGTASMGGMYGSGVHGAYGRLWAWKSMAGLSGASADASAEEVEEQARRSTWFHFQADADWFHNDIDADYGIAALSPDRSRIAVLAATDAD
ncbi:DUF6183 family protein [Streptomyces violascens]|uniref:DUF6183 family protein n=1 Tax=Streptomyces violascens TaxID=67381 RepID=UPI003787C0A8